MTLSPATIAVDDALAACIRLQGEIIRVRPLAAAALLRALADQVVPEEDWPDQSIGFADWNLATERCEQRKNIRAEILAIAAELEGADDCC